MRKLSVDVYEDLSRPEGGHAVIRLNGLDRLPDSVTFRIRPVDSASAADGAWPNADRHPLVTRQTKEGAEIVVGPEIVESPLFLPGTLAAIEIQTCDVRGEFLWPRISPLVRPKRRHLLGAKAPRETKADIAEPIVFGEAHDASSELVPEPKLLEPFEAPAPSAPMAGAFTPAEPAAAASSIVLPESIGGATNVATPEIGAPASPMSHGASTSEPAAAKPDIVWSDLSKERAPARWRRLAIGIGGIGLVASALIYLLASGGPSAPAATAGVNGDLAAVLSVGTVSPRGLKTREHTPLQLIESADALLHAPDGKRDRAEASFLLRRYLASTLSDERTLWALSQLGSVYAEPDGTRAPDYARARQMWELAAALGDPVAMCFLAALHEHGLGTKASKPAALQWYLRAKDGGGCANIDDAIARVRK